VEVCAQKDSEFRDLMETAMQLTDYAVTDRYPDNWREIPLSEATNAVEKATGIFRMVKQKLERNL
jgi:HEPN domain-containing protein